MSKRESNMSESKTRLPSGTLVQVVSTGAIGTIRDRGGVRPDSPHYVSTGPSFGVHARPSDVRPLTVEEYRTLRDAKEAREEVEVLTRGIAEREEWFRTINAKHIEMTGDEHPCAARFRRALERSRAKLEAAAR
jgi:hypothetical protein